VRQTELVARSAANNSPLRPREKREDVIVRMRMHGKNGPPLQEYTVNSNARVFPLRPLPPADVSFDRAEALASLIDAFLEKEPTPLSQ